MKDHPKDLQNNLLVENYKNMKASKWAELCFEMGLIEAKALTYEEEKARGLSNTGSRKIYVTLGTKWKGVCILQE